MEMKVREDQKIVEIWLTKEEQNDPVIQEQLRALYPHYTEKKYLVAVFQSGEEDLFEQTSGLLCYNRRRWAEKEAQKQKDWEGPSISM